MMQKNTKQQQRRRQAKLSALSSGCALLLSAGVLMGLHHIFCPRGLLSILLRLAAALDFVCLIPLAVCLRSRFKEIQGGEEDEACQY